MTTKIIDNNLMENFLLFPSLVKFSCKELNFLKQSLEQTDNRLNQTFMAAIKKCSQLYCKTLIASAELIVSSFRRYFSMRK